MRRANDFNVEDQSPFDEASGDLTELKFTAPSAGAMPLRISTCDSVGTYDFTAYVEHGVALGLARFKSVEHNGKVTVFAHTPDGGVIDDPALSVAVQMKRGSHWAAIGSAPIANSAATVRLSIPRRIHSKKITLRAASHGAGYLAKTSASRTVKLRPLKK